MKNVICPLNKEEISEIERGIHIIKEYGLNPFQILVIYEKYYDSGVIENQYEKIIETGDDLFICSLTKQDINILRIGGTVITAEFDDGEVEVAIINNLDYEDMKKGI